MTETSGRLEGQPIALPAYTWLITGDRAHLLGTGSLPAGTDRRDSILVEAGSEDEALQRAREYCASRRG